MKWIGRTPGWVILFLLPALIGCGRTDEIRTEEPAAPAAVKASPPATGDWLVSHSLSDPEQLNPLTSNDASSSEILGYIFESMLSRDPRTLELKPALATARPEISPDRLIYTFTLRRDVHFQDGRPFTADDVLFSVKALKCPFVNAPFLRVYFNSVVDVEKIDDYTIRFITKEQYFLNESQLGSITILPRHFYDPENLLANISVRQLSGDPAKLPESAKRFGEAFNKNYSRNPLGSGPYKFSEWKTGRELELRRDPKYWGNGKEGIDQPHIDVIKYRIVNNLDAALTTLKSGGLDEMGLTPIQHIRGTSSERFNNEFQKFEYFAPSYSYIGWNHLHPIFRDKRVRQAMTYLTNRQQMVKTILFGLGTVVDSPIYFFRPEYDKTLFSHPYDPAKAQELLKEAGWEDTDGDGILDKEIDGQRIPLRFELKINSGNTTRKSVALIFQDEVKKRGIEVTVRELDWTIFLADVQNRQFDAVILGWAMPSSEPDAFQVWHSSQAVKKGSNHISYKNPKVDKILETYRREFDEAKRIELYREFQQLLNEDQPYTFLFAGKSASVVNRRFRNVQVYPSGLRAIEWWVPRPLQRYSTQLEAH